MRSSVIRLLAVLLCAGSLLSMSGCFAVANLDRFEETCTGDSSETRDFNFEITSLNPHMGELFELKVIRARPVPPVGPPVPIASVVYDGIDPMNPIVAGTLRNALPPGEYEAQFWGAFGGRRTWVLGGMDHSWDEPVPANGCFAFVHGSPFDADITPTDDPAIGNVTMTLSDVGDSAGSPLFWRVRDQRGADVGLYRLDSLPAAVDGRVMTLPDIAIDDETYAVVAFIDADRSNDRGDDEPQFTLEPVGARGGVAAFTLDLSNPD